MNELKENIVINVSSLSKRYGLPLPKSLRNIRNFLKFNRVSSISQSVEWALQDISFQVMKGEFLGVIGKNGSGKSTLLKVLAGVSPPTKGKVEIRGRIFPMIELNAGLHRELTGRENVRLLGVIMGFLPFEIESRMPEIEAFTELGEWFDQPVRKYSSGMIARLGFGVAMNVDAEVLLIDEVLAVGDLSFQRRCFDKLGELRSSGVTTIFVSHALRQVERLCDRAMLLANGKIEEMGGTAEVVHQYYKTSSSVNANNSRVLLSEKIIATGEVSLVSVDVLNNEFEPVDEVEFRQPIILRVVYNAHDRLEKPNVAIGVMTADFIEITNFSTDNEKNRPDWHGQGAVFCTISDLRLLPGVYYLKVFIRRRDGFKCLQSYRVRMFTVVSKNYDIMRNNLGFFHTEVAWSFEMQDNSAATC